MVATVENQRWRDARLRVTSEYERMSGRELGNGLYPYEYIAQVGKAVRIELESGEAAAWRIAEQRDSSIVVYDSQGRLEEQIEVVFGEARAHDVAAMNDGTAVFFQVS
ncbi:hypothetical protein CTAYLR_005043 [Chrysophaeum taylorii]|uniref:Uncharacterized protein n=1 Tax=Chrysophaeum taylorii TaxID=2483200 RepID=A0AAD7U9T0_9STRA|nr:hypothetical protein CTAYLR_005043 [Chrysophaeum taylorii]